MRVAIIRKDKPGALQIRLDTRPNHAAYLKTGNMVEMAGPLLDEQESASASSNRYRPAIPFEREFAAT